MAEPRVQKTPRLPLELARKLEEESRNTGESENSIIVTALELYLKTKKEDDNMFKVSSFQEFARKIGDSQLASAYWSEWFEGGEEEEKEYFAFNDYLCIRKENGECIPEF